MPKWKVMLCEQFFEVEADTEDDVLNEASAQCFAQTTPDDFVVLGPAESEEVSR